MGTKEGEREIVPYAKAFPVLGLLRWFVGRTRVLVSFCFDQFLDTSHVYTRWLFILAHVMYRWLPLVVSNCYLPCIHVYICGHWVSSFLHVFAVLSRHLRCPICRVPNRRLQALPAVVFAMAGPSSVLAFLGWPKVYATLGPVQLNL